MAYRTTPLVNDQIYHIFNRGVEKRRIFETIRDYKRFLKTLQYYTIEGPKPKFSHFSNPKLSKIDPSKKIVEIIAYCLIPNHFHLLIKQKRENGISEYVSKISNSYTKYYNLKYTRVGPLLQGQFKAVLVESDDQLLHLSRYIHLNPLVSFLIKDLEDYPWSSYNEYMENINGFCSKSYINNFFPKSKDYRQFILDQVDYAKKLDYIKHQLLD